MAKGFMIAIEGIDQSGKRTQTRLLVERLRRQGHGVESISFPDYSTVVGGEIEAFLAGDRSYNSQARHMLLSLNRWERADDLVRWLDGGRMVVLNRYSGSNYAYGVASGLDVGWLVNLEKGLPESSLTVLLDVSFDTSLERKVSERDMHERDQEFLRRVRDEYLKLADREGWRVIDGGRDSETVHSDIWRTVTGFLESAAHVS